MGIDKRGLSLQLCELCLHARVIMLGNLDLAGQNNSQAMTRLAHLS